MLFTSAVTLTACCWCRWRFTPPPPLTWITEPGAAGSRPLFTSSRTIRLVPSRASSSSLFPNEDRRAISPDYDDSRDLLGLDVDSRPRDLISNKGRSWFGPNGQYIRELPCPSCRGRGYTPCTDCGVGRSRRNCSACNGTGLKTCQQCLGDRVIWEESIDERPWEKAQSSSPFKVKEDDEVDKLEIKVDAMRRSKRVYKSPSPEVGQKISRSLKILNAKTGLFSKRMKILHRDPLLRAQRVAAIKKAKGTPAARLHASETMKAFFGNPENRVRRSIAMKGVKFHCSYCGKEGHRKHYCPSLRSISGKGIFRCGLCGVKGHNRRTCGKSKSEEESKCIRMVRQYRCKLCMQVGHNRRTCPHLVSFNLESSDVNFESQSLATSLECKSKRTYTCSFCLKKGHNIRTCPDKVAKEDP